MGTTSSGLRFSPLGKLALAGASTSLALILFGAFGIDAYLSHLEANTPDALHESVHVEMRSSSCSPARPGCAVVHARVRGAMKGKDFWCTGTIWQTDTSKASNIPECDPKDYPLDYVPVRNYEAEFDFGAFGGCDSSTVRFTLVKGERKLATAQIDVLPVRCQ